MSYLEVYNECINDLLNAENTNLDVQTDSRHNSIISNLSQEVVSKEIKIFEWLEQGERVRKVASTHFNEKSSRSHTIFRINISMNNTVGNKIITKSSEINLVDLAGSEGIGAGNNATRARESSNINKSLLYLSKIIQELGSKSSNKNVPKFISYRHSKLTRILQNALSGNSKTSVICTINQAGHNKNESLSTLKFGVKAKNIKTKLSINEVSNKTSIDYDSYRQMEEENYQLKQKLQQTEEDKKKVDQLMDSPKTSEKTESRMGRLYLQEVLNYTQTKLQEEVSKANKYHKSLITMTQEKQKLENDLMTCTEIKKEVESQIKWLEIDIQSIGKSKAAKQMEDEDNVRMYSLNKDLSCLPRNMLNSCDKSKSGDRFCDIEEEGYNLKEMIDLQEKLDSLQEECSKKDTTILQLHQQISNMQIQNGNLVSNMDVDQPIVQTQPDNSHDEWTQKLKQKGSLFFDHI